MNKIADPNNLLRDIDEAQCRALAELIRTYNYGYGHDMMTVFFPVRSIMMMRLTQTLCIMPMAESY